MQIREAVAKLVDADVETGAETPVVARDAATGLMYSIKEIEVQSSEYEEGNRLDTGPSVWIIIEEM